MDNRIFAQQLAEAHGYEVIKITPINTTRKKNGSLLSSSYKGKHKALFLGNVYCNVYTEGTFGVTYFQATDIEGNTYNLVESYRPTVPVQEFRNVFQAFSEIKFLGTESQSNFFTFTGFIIEVEEKE